MKAKVFKYKPDGDTVVTSYMKLKPYAENVYLSLSRKDEYGDEDDNCPHMICRTESVYFFCGQCSRQPFSRGNHREETVTCYKNWITDTLQGVERGVFVKLISVHTFEAFGLDTTPLMQAYEAYKKKQEQKRREREKKEAEEHRAQEGQHQLLLDEQEWKFLDGERITEGIFLEIIGGDGFDIRIRTKGILSRHVRDIDRNEAISLRKTKGRRIPNFTGYHKVVPAYLTFIIEKEDKQ